MTGKELARTAEVDALLGAGAPVAIGVSGGKDSCAVAFAVCAFLDAIGHRGPRVLVHSDLGITEWRESLPTCRRLADRLGIELIVLRRAAGDMMDRWESRWAANVRRYVELLCVKLILPWSTAAMRFCTAELKRDVICSALVKRFPGQRILSVSGIRREESAKRRTSPITKEQCKLTNRAHRTTGLDWHPLLDWTLAEVLAYLDANGFPLHEAYTRYGSSRVSCCFCILGSRADLAAAASCPDNHDLYRRMVNLEIRSTFAFQEHWLGDLAPHLLSPEQRRGLASAKERAERRQAVERLVPKHLLYTAGWPTCMPTAAEAVLLSEVRLTVAGLLGLSINYSTPHEILARYAELMAAKEAA